MGLASIFNPWILLLFLIKSIPFSSSQANAPPPSSQDSDLCNGIFISYTYTTGIEIKPKNTSNQPYRFESVLTILNNGQNELKSWRVFVGFVHREILVSATNAILFDGSTLPVSVENGTIFAGSPVSDLKSAIMTAGDINQMQARVELVGTQFGVASPNVPLPKNISLVNDGWECPKATQRGRNVLQLCCRPLPINKTQDINQKYLQRQQGDLTIMYDVTRTYKSNYWSQVTIENHNPLGRLDNWKLSFQWMKDEFIFTTKGAYPNIIDSSDCINGPQGRYYQDLDFSNVLTCARKPTIIDLPLTKFNDSTLGLIPFCCRNGTILPKPMDPTKSKSVFEMQVFKMPPNLNISDVSPPLNWEITGNHYNPEYKCGLPLQVTPSQFPDLTGLPSNRTAFASWQIVCNITQPKPPKCCVSFSSYFNDSIIPCNTCACGGCSNDDQITSSCSTDSPALLLPPQALLIPFENRTKLTTTWADLKHRQVPDPLPCGDNCGVSINWHLATDYRGGWSARVTLFNWGETNFADWFTAIELRNAVPGFEKAYSFNGTSVSINGINNTILMQGLPGLNYLVAQTEPENLKKDYSVPGKQQSVISFTKKLTPKINVGAGDGFPTKVFFNGQECSLPLVLPTSNSYKRFTSLLIALPFLVFLILRL